MSQTRVTHRFDSTSKDGPPRALLGVSVVYLANAAVGTWLAVRYGLSGRPFGWETGLTPLSNFIFGLGTALSAPLVLLVTLVVLNLRTMRGGRDSRQAAGLLALLATGFLTGMLAEPIAWETLHSASSHSLQTPVVIANILLPIALVALALRVRSGLRPVAEVAK